jgi:hypothetical protein
MIQEATQVATLPMMMTMILLIWVEAKIKLGLVTMAMI